ncbi:MFS transporter [Paenibacillus sp. HW567]|uniref:MFS transporter n=1 Tax=Paenibacillus sp. HW567 TaxID=1034769 RepID=UPI0003814134|nr:MFS transporter [Paenibacillus sp. HW567]
MEHHAKIRYERAMVILFFFTWGFTFFNRLSINFVMPVIMDDLHLSSSDVGLVAFVSTITLAFSSIIFGRLSDRQGLRKRFLVPAVLTVSVFTLLSFFAHSFMALLILRGLVGVGLGPILPMIMSLNQSASSENKLGRNTGFILTGDAILASTLGPVIITQLTNHFSWQTTLVISGIPALVMGWLVLKHIKEIDSAASLEESRDPQAEALPVQQVLKYPNIALCFILTVLTIGAFFIIVTYAPLYLTEVEGYSVSSMGVISSIMGIVYIPFALSIPRITDKFGRKPVITFTILLCSVAPLFMFLFPNTLFSVGAYILFGGLAGTIHVFLNTIIPMESLPDKLKTTGSSLIIATGEIIGAAGIPFAAGYFAESYGYAATMLGSAILFLCSFLMAFFLKESNRSIAKRTAVQPSMIKKVDASVSK